MEGERQVCGKHGERRIFAPVVTNTGQPSDNAQAKSRNSGVLAKKSSLKAKKPGTEVPGFSFSGAVGKAF
jgi:hypothetical protein